MGGPISMTGLFCIGQDKTMGFSSSSSFLIEKCRVVGPIGAVRCLFARSGAHHTALSRLSKRGACASDTYTRPALMLHLAHSRCAEPWASMGRLEQITHNDSHAAWR